VPSTHAVAPLTPIVPTLRVPQQSEPVGHVSAVHDSETPLHELWLSQVCAAPPMPAVVQHTSGGLHTAWPHGNAPPSTMPASTGRPPLLLPLPPLLLPLLLLPPLLPPLPLLLALPSVVVPLLLPEPLLLPLVPSLPASPAAPPLVVAPPHAQAAAMLAMAMLPRNHERFMFKPPAKPSNQR
jgi:hypothetical protein